MRKALLVVLILSSALAWAQGGCTGQKPLNGMTTGGFLKGVANASVRVCSDTLTPCTTIPLFSDAALTHSISNPVMTDVTGNYQYCAAGGSYNEQISGSAFSTVNNTPVTISGGDVKSLTAQFFGVHYNRSSPTDHGAFPLTPNIPLGFGAMRLWDTQTSWLHVEPSAGTFVWTNLDYLVNFATTNNMDVLLTLGQPPTWATGGTRGGTQGTNYNAHPPTNNQDWVDYVTAVATRYKGQIHYYEVWNEPNLTDFYDGTQAELATLTQLAYTTIKAIDPTAQIVSASPTASAGVTYLDGYLSAGAAAYVDIVGVHLYVSPLEPEAMIDLARQYRAVADKYNLISKPMWNTETGWFNHVEGGSTVTTVMSDKMSASYVIREYLAAWIAGVDRNYFYAVDNFGSNINLVNDGVGGDDAIQPAGFALQRFITWAIGQRIDDFEHNADGSYVLTTTDASGKHWWLLWTADTAASTLSIISESGITKSVTWDNSTSYLNSASTLSADMAPQTLSGLNPFSYRRVLFGSGGSSGWTPNGSGLVATLPTLLPDGSCSAPAYSFANATTTGLTHAAGISGLQYCIGGSTVLSVFTDSLRIKSGNHITDSTTGDRMVTLATTNAVANSTTNRVKLISAASGGNAVIGIASDDSTGANGDTNVGLDIQALGSGAINIKAPVTFSVPAGCLAANCVAVLKLTGQTAGIAATTLYTPSVTGTYAVNAFLHTETASGTTGTAALTYNFNDGVARSGFGAGASVQLFNTGGSSWTQSTITLHLVSGQAFQYIVTKAGDGTPAYGLDIVVTRLQ